jgi:hypothetical protein
MLAAGADFPEHRVLVRPVKSGTSTSVQNVDGTGTITSTQFVDSDGKRVLTSNNHVWAHNGLDGVVVGANLVQPGVADSPNGGVIGKLKRFVTVKVLPGMSSVIPPEEDFNFIDLALCDPTLSSDQYSNESLNVGKCPGTYQANPEDAVEYTPFTISSRTSGTHDTLITATQVMGWIQGYGGFAFFVDQIYLEPGSVYPGDSGSPLIKKTTKELTGRVFAGGTDGSGLANDVWFDMDPNYGNLKFVADNWGTNPEPPDNTFKHTYQNPGTYTLIVNVTDANGKTGTGIATITVTPNGQLSITIALDKDTGPAPLTINATANVQGATLPLTFQWSAGE